VKKLTTLLRLVVVLLRIAGFRLTHEQLPDGRQSPDLAGHRSCLSVCAIAGAPAVLAIVSKSVSRLATTPARVCTRRPIILSAHVTASTHAGRDPGDQGHGDRGGVPARSDRDARRLGAATRQGLGISLDVVPSGADVRLAPAVARAPGEAEGGPSHHAT